MSIKRLKKKEVEFLGKDYKGKEKCGRNKRYSLSEEELIKLEEFRSTSVTVGYDDKLSAWCDIEKRVLSVGEWCKRHNIEQSLVRSSKLITHTGIPHYNIVFNSKEENVDIESLLADVSKNVTPYTRNPQTKVSDKALHVYLSDLHVGSKVENSTYENEYNKDVFRERMERVFDLIVDAKNANKKFDTLLVSNLGDALDGLDGYTSRGGHKLPQNMTNKEAFNVYLNEYKRLIASVVENDVANNYVIHFITDDNHSSIFGWLAARAIQEYVNARYKFIDVIVQDKFIDVYKYGVHNFLFTHGKDEKEMRSGFPKVLDKRTEIYFKDYIDYHNLKGQIHVIKGDLHQDCVDFCNRFRYRNVLSLYGASRWIHFNFGWNRAGVSYEVVSKTTDDIKEGRLFL